MRLVLLSFLICAVSLRAHAQEISSVQQTFAFNLSNPLVVSASTGMLWTPGHQQTPQHLPDHIGLRLDGELGLGGYFLSTGVYFPVDRVAGIDIKLGRLHTWDMAWGAEENQNFNGVRIDYQTGGHVPFRVGLGYFKNTEEEPVADDDLLMFSVGVGW